MIADILPQDDVAYEYISPATSWRVDTRQGTRRSKRTPLPPWQKVADEGQRVAGNVGP